MTDAPAPPHPPIVAKKPERTTKPQPRNGSARIQPVTTKRTLRGE